MLVADDDAILGEIARAMLRERASRADRRKRRRCGRRLRAAYARHRAARRRDAGGNGYQACTNIRSLPGGADLPIVMVTGRDDTASIDQAYEAGATDFVVKPINWPLLVHRIRYILRGARTLVDLRFSEQKNAALLKAIPDGIFLLSAEGHCALFQSRCRIPISADGFETAKRGFEAARFLISSPGAARAGECMDAASRGEAAAFEFSFDAGRGRIATLNAGICRMPAARARDRARRHGARGGRARIHRLAYFDALTGLPNREWIHDYLASR